MTCHTCLYALVRSDSPGKHYSYEACSVGVIPMVPQLPTVEHDCRMWAPGGEKEPQGIDIIFGEDIEL